MKTTAILILMILSMNANANVSCIDNALTIIKNKLSVKSDSTLFYEKMESALSERIDSGEITKSDSEAISSAVKTFRKTTGEDLIDSGIITCYTDFSEVAFKNVNALMFSASDAKNSNEAFTKLIKKSKEIFSESDEAAKRRICGLSHPKANCKIFSSSIIKNVNCN